MRIVQIFPAFLASKEEVKGERSRRKIKEAADERRAEEKRRKRVVGREKRKDKMWQFLNFKEY